MSTKTLRVWLSMILSVVFLTACSLIRDRAARFPAPDLAAIYLALRGPGDGSVTQASPDSEPVGGEPG